MAQTLLAFDAHPADPQVGFELGWDHAHHGLVPPPEQWLDGNPLHQGWRAGRACFGGRTLGASRRVRLWLRLRLHAWLRGRAFELGEVTPHYLGQIEVPVCPITRQVDAALPGPDRGAAVPDHAPAAGAGRGFGGPGLRSRRLCRRQPGDDQPGGQPRQGLRCGWDEALVHVHQAEAAESRTRRRPGRRRLGASGGADLLRHAAAARAGGTAAAARAAAEPAAPARTRCRACRRWSRAHWAAPTARAACVRWPRCCRARRCAWTSIAFSARCCRGCIGAGPGRRRLRVAPRAGGRLVRCPRQPLLAALCACSSTKR